MTLILLNVNSWALEKAMKMRYLPIMKFDLKTFTKKRLAITIDKYLNFNEPMTNIWVLVENLLHCRECPLFLVINRKRCQTLSLFGCSEFY